MLIYTVFGPLLSLTLHNSACSSPNGTLCNFSGEGSIKSFSPWRCSCFVWNVSQYGIKPFYLHGDQTRPSYSSDLWRGNPAHSQNAVFSRQSYGHIHRSKQVTDPQPKGSMFDPRTFSGQFVSVHDDLVDYLDLSELNTLGGSGSGLGPEQHPVKKQVHYPKKEGHYIVSEQSKEFLQGRLATLFVPTFYILVFFVSVPLNLVAVVMFVRYIRPRKPAVIYMLNLSCADLFYGLLLPFKISYHYHGNNWIYGDWICRTVTAAFYCNMYCSVLLISCIGVDRFLAVVYPINSLRWRSPRTASSVCISIWLLALVGVAPLLFSTQTVHLPQMNITTCHDVQDTQKLQSYYLYFFPIYVTIFFFIPLVLTVVCYVRIVQALTESNVETKSKKTRAVVMTVLVLVMFVICFTPTNIILMVHYVQLSHVSSDSTYQAYLLSLCIGSLSCCLDPLLYYFGSSQCQRQVLIMFRFRRRGFPISSSYKTQSTRSSGFNGSICKVETLGSQYT